MSHIYDEKELRALHAPTAVHLAVDAEDGACFTDCEGETTRGEHGFSLDKPAARTLFWLAGPGVKKDYIVDQMNLVDIAPTLAKAAGLSLPDADGRALTDLFT